MYSFYIQRGHTLEELQSLPIEQELFYMVTMELYYERIADILSSTEDNKKNSPNNKLNKGVNNINGI